MEFLTFLAERFDVSPREASRRLERALSNYQPSKPYTIRVLGSGEAVTPGRVEPGLTQES